MTDSGYPENYSIINQYIVDRINNESVASKRIYFHQANTNYNWFDTNNLESYTTLPIQFDLDEWYIIRGLMKLGNPDWALLMSLDSDGELFHYEFSESKNW